MTRMTFLGKRRGESQKGNLGIVGKGAALVYSYTECQEIFLAQLALIFFSRSLLPPRCSKVYSTITRRHTTYPLTK